MNANKAKKLVQDAKDRIAATERIDLEKRDKLRKLDEAAIDKKFPAYWRKVLKAVQKRAAVGETSTTIYLDTYESVSPTESLYLICPHRSRHYLADKLVENLRKRGYSAETDNESGQTFRDYCTVSIEWR